MKCSFTFQPFHLRIQVLHLCSHVLHLWSISDPLEPIAIAGTGLICSSVGVGSLEGLAVSLAGIASKKNYVTERDSRSRPYIVMLFL